MTTTPIEKYTMTQFARNRRIRVRAVESIRSDLLLLSIRKTEAGPALHFVSSDYRLLRAHGHDTHQVIPTEFVLGLIQKLVAADSIQKSRLEQLIGEQATSVLLQIKSPFERGVMS